MAQIELTVPDLGGFSEIPVIEVLVQPGDTVEKETPLVMLESDKATMEVPASAGGVVKDIRVKIGDKVSQGSVLVTVDSAEPAATATPVAATPATPPAPNADPVGAVAADAGASEEATAPPPGGAALRQAQGSATQGTGALRQAQADTTRGKPALRQAQADTDVGPDANSDVQRDDVRGDKPDVTLSSSKGEASRPDANQTSNDANADVTLSSSKGDRINGAPANGAAAAQPSDAASAQPSGAPMHASPAIRRFARELGVELSHVRGSGPNGRITREDVQTFVKTAIATPAPARGAGTSGGFVLDLPPWPKVDFAKFGPVERVALTRIQKISGPVLARNWVMIPHVTQNEDADVTELEAFRKQINGERKDVKVTMLAFLMKAAVAALERFPQFNSSLDGDELVLKKYYNLGFAADTPNGLVVPVIKDADRKGIVQIARETAELGAKARDGKLGPAEMSGATFTISSLGSIGGTTFTPIINAPEVAILGACKAEIRPVWDGAAFVPRLIQPLSLSYDHRVIDGANAARFCVALKESLADLRRVLL
jgi:pyruvate dehydrogenase E2 component (dihydrolipoamide acetyltransferase)